MVDWEFHDKRVITHAKAYGLHADTVNVEDTLSYFYMGSINLAKYQNLLDEFTKREQGLLLRVLSGKRGTMLKWITKFRGGSVMDVKVVKDESGNKKLELLNTTGKKRMQQVNS